MPGYLPTLPQEPDAELVEAVKIAAGGKYEVEIEGNFHSADFKVADEELAYIVTAKVIALGAYRLLKDSTKEAKKIAAEYKPKFTKEEYVAFMDSMIKEGIDIIQY